MGSKSDYLEDAVLNSVFRGVAFPTIGTVYVALFTSAPSDAGGGTECTGGSYARVAVTCNGTTFSAPADSAGSEETHNAGAVTFPTPSAAWGTVTHFGIFDAATNGNLLYWGALTAQKSVNNGDPAPSFAASALSLKED